MKKLFIALFLSIAFAGSAFADGLFTKVSTWTLEGTERVLTKTANQVLTV